MGDEDLPRLLRLAMDAHRSGRLVEADALYGQVLALGPGTPAALRLRGILARERGETGESIGLLRRAVAAAPADPEPLCELGLSYFVAGYLQLAEQACRRARDLAPTHLKAIANLGAVLQYRGHFRAAVACSRQAVALAPGDRELWANLANALAESGEGEEALLVCDEALGQLPDDPLLLATRGGVLCALERFPEAVGLLERAIDRGPADDLVLVNLARAREGTGDASGAIATLRRALTRTPANARAAADLMGLLVGSGAPGEAVAVGADFLVRHPGERLVLAALAFALGDAGRREEAVALLDLDRLVQVRDLPPAAGYPDLAAFHRELTGLLLADPSLLANPLSKSTRGGRQTGELDLAGASPLRAWRDQVSAAFQSWASALAGSALAIHPAMVPARADHTLRAWATVLEPGGCQIPHIHPLAWYSGVYYVAVPDGMDGDGADAGAGWLEFFRPPARVLLRSPPASRRVEPRPGRLVLFPSYFYHCTRPYQGPGQRISLAFDVVPVGGPPA